MVAICLVGLMTFVGCNSCENKDDIVEDYSIVGKWVVDNFLGTSSYIVFTENLRVERYFDWLLSLCECSSPYVTYSLSDNKISLTIHDFHSDIMIAHFEKFKYSLTGDLLTIRDFSNPFGLTTEGRLDVHFRRVE